MRSVKLVTVLSRYADEGNLYSITDSISDWEEIDEESYSKLKKNMYNLQSSIGRELDYGESIVLLEKGRPTVANALIKIDDILKQHEAKEATDKLKREAAAVKAAAAKSEKDKNKVAKLQAQLAKLQGQVGDITSK